VVKVFVSYAHSEQSWVLDRLVPVLEAGGAEIIIDIRQFRAGRTVIGEMDQWQDQADRHVLVITRDYLASNPCMHELERAIRRDPTFTAGIVLPVRRDDAPLPPKITIPNPSLYVDLKDDRDAASWGRLLTACAADLGMPAPHWLEKRDEIARYLTDRRSVNLVVDNGTPWRPLLDHVRTRPGLAMPVIDLESGAVVKRPALLREVLRGLGSRTVLPERKGDDLIAFQAEIMARDISRVALVHFDMVRHHAFKEDVPLFAALRHLINTERKLAVLVASHAPFLTLLPPNHPMSEIDMATVSLSKTP
jgi:hypothetical protein